MNTFDQDFLTTIREMVANERDVTVPTNDDELLNEAKTTFANLEKFQGIDNYEDSELGVAAQSLIAAAKAVVQIKQATANGQDMQAADLAAVVEFNDIKNTIQEHYLNLEQASGKIEVGELRSERSARKASKGILKDDVVPVSTSFNL